jgi:hypothetical protein
MRLGVCFALLCAKRPLPLRRFGWHKDPAQEGNHAIQETFMCVIYTTDGMERTLSTGKLLLCCLQLGLQALCGSLARDSQGLEHREHVLNTLAALAERKQTIKRNSITRKVSCSHTHGHGETSIFKARKASSWHGGRTATFARVLSS